MNFCSPSTIKSQESRDETREREREMLMYYRYYGPTKRPLQFTNRATTGTRSSKSAAMPRATHEELGGHLAVTQPRLSASSCRACQRASLGAHSSATVAHAWPPRAAPVPWCVQYPRTTWCRESGTNLTWRGYGTTMPTPCCAHERASERIFSRIRKAARTHSALCGRRRDSRKPLHRATKTPQTSKYLVAS